MGQGQGLGLCVCVRVCLCVVYACGVQWGGVLGDYLFGCSAAEHLRLGCHCFR
jgi:hypothetical protein